MGWSMTKPKRKKKRKELKPLEEFRFIKGAKRTRLVAARKEKGLTQTELGKLVGCSTGYISHLENGRLDPGIDIALKLEMVLETPYLELFPNF